MALFSEHRVRDDSLIRSPVIPSQARDQCPCNDLPELKESIQRLIQSFQRLEANLTHRLDALNERVTQLSNRIDAANAPRFPDLRQFMQSKDPSFVDMG